MLVPVVEVVDVALEGPVADGDAAVVSIVPDFEGVGSVVVVVDLEDEGGGVGGVLNDAVLALVVEVGSVEVVLVDALGAGQPQSRNEVHDRGVVGRVEGPLHSRVVFCDLLEVMHCFVEVAGGSGPQLILVVEQLYVSLQCNNCVQVLLNW